MRHHKRAVIPNLGYIWRQAFTPSELKRCPTIPNTPAKGSAGNRRTDHPAKPPKPWPNQPLTKPPQTTAKRDRWFSPSVCRAAAPFFVLSSCGVGGFVFECVSGLWECVCVCVCASVCVPVVVSVSVCSCLRVHVHVTEYPDFLATTNMCVQTFGDDEHWCSRKVWWCEVWSDIWCTCGRGPFSIRRGAHIMQQMVWSMFLRKEVPLGMKVWWGLLLLKKKTCYTLVRKCRWSHTSPRQTTTTDHHHDHSTAQNGTPQHHNHTTTTPLHHLHTRRPLSVHLTRIQVHHTHTHTHRPQTPSPGGAALPPSS